MVWRLSATTADFDLWLGMERLEELVVGSSGRWRRSRVQRRPAVRGMWRGRPSDFRILGCYFDDAGRRFVIVSSG